MIIIMVNPLKNLLRNKKVKKGGGQYKADAFKLARIDKYFRENKLTMEKILMLEKGTGYDLSKYKRKINEKN